MDGVIKIPKQGAKRLRVVKERLPGRMHVAMLVPPSLPSVSSLLQKHHTYLSHLPLSKLYWPSNLNLILHFPGSFLWLPLSDYNLPHLTSHQILLES